MKLPDFLIKTEKKNGGVPLKILNIKDEEINLLQALKPFLNSKAQEMVELVTVVLNIFKPEEPDVPINIQALNTLLSMVDEKKESQSS